MKPFYPFYPEISLIAFLEEADCINGVFCVMGQTPL
jgi:hypothetical protein